MGIIVEFNPDLALRNYSEFESGNRQVEECIPKTLKKDETYEFLKKGQRNYWFGGELPLLETEGNQKLSRPKASIVILEAAHFNKAGEIWTKGRYLVKEVFKDNNVHFESYAKL